MADTLMYVEGSNNGSSYPYICHKRNSSFTQTKGLLNRPGQNNCFLNSAVQVLWHLDIFRSSFRETTSHKCVGDMCIFCALKELFTQFQYSGDAALPPDALRKALAQTFYNQQKFQLGYMDDAAECFENILMRIHFHITNGEAEDMCHDIKCIPHQKFAMTLVEQGICLSCGATTEPLPFTQMVYYISSSMLCAQERFQREVPIERFGQLLRRASEIGDVKDCPSACGAKIQIQKSLMSHPEIISIGIAWDSERPTLDHIMDVFSTIGTVIQLQDVFHSIVDRKWASTVKHHLVGVVTYYGKHYSTFFFHTKLRMWIYFDDATVRQVGPCWEHVVDKCRRGHFQPLLLLYANFDAVPVSSYKSAVPTTTMDIARAPVNQPQQQRNCVTPNQHLQKLQMNGLGYDLDSDTGYSSSDRSPNSAKHPYETSYDYYKANGHHQRYNCSESSILKKLAPPNYFNFDQPDGPYHKMSDIIAPSTVHLNQPNRNSRNANCSYEDNGYISRKAVESVLNYQKALHTVGLPCPQPGQRHELIVNRAEPGPQRHVNPSYPASQYQPEVNDYARNAQMKDINRSGAQNAQTMNGYPSHSKISSRGPYDAGYDSFSLSSNDSYPVNQNRPVQYSNGKTNENISTGNPSESHASVPISNGVTDVCQSLCWEADNYLKQSVDRENIGDIETAINLCNGAAAKARAAMDAPYSNPHSLVLAQRKHNTCIMRARSLHRRILARQDSINSYSSSTGTETDTMMDTMSVNSASNVARPVYHSRQSSRDSTYRRSLGNHSRQSSRDRSNGPSPAGMVAHGRQNSQDSTADKRRIEVYATLPKSAAKKKSAIKNLLPSLKSDTTKAPPVEQPNNAQMRDEAFWRNGHENDIHNGYLSSCESQPQVPKKSNPLCRTNSIPPKLYNTAPIVVPDAQQQQLRLDEEKMAAKVEKNKQHRVRRKCLMGGLLRRKNNSMPDLREDLVNSNTNNTVKAFEEGLSPAKSEQNLSEKSQKNVRVPPPPPIRTTSQLSIRSQSHGNLIPAAIELPPPIDRVPNDVIRGFHTGKSNGYSVKPPAPTPPNEMMDEFDLPPPPPSLLIPPPAPINYYSDNNSSCKAVPEVSTLPHWLKELQNKQQQIGQRTVPYTPNPETVPTFNCINAAGNTMKKLALPNQSQPIATMASNQNVKLSSNQMIAHQQSNQIISHQSSHDIMNYHHQTNQMMNHQQSNQINGHPQTNQMNGHSQHNQMNGHPQPNQMNGHPQPNQMMNHQQSNNLVNNHQSNQHQQNQLVGHQQPYPGGQVANQTLSSDDYKSRSVRDLASKFEQKLHLGLPNANPMTKPPAPEIIPPKASAMDDHNVIRSSQQSRAQRPVAKSPTAQVRTSDFPYKEPQFDHSQANAKVYSGSVDQVDAVKIGSPNLRLQSRTPPVPEILSSSSPNKPSNLTHRSDNQSEFQNGMRPKSKGAKKSVKFSDQIILVAGADESENLFDSPLFKKVLQKSISAKGQEQTMMPNDSRLDYHYLPRKPAASPTPTQQLVPGTINKQPCSLCHKKMVVASNPYCADCEFYMSRFKPKR